MGANDTSEQLAAAREWASKVEADNERLTASRNRLRATLKVATDDLRAMKAERDQLAGDRDEWRDCARGWAAGMPDRVAALMTARAERDWLAATLDAVRKANDAARENARDSEDWVDPNARRPSILVRLGNRLDDILDAAPAALLHDRDAETIDIVFDGPPAAQSGRFVEVENMSGASIRVGEWIDRGDGYWALRIPYRTEQGEQKRVLMTHPHDGHGPDDTCFDCEQGEQG